MAVSHLQRVCIWGVGDDLPFLRRPAAWGLGSLARAEVGAVAAVSASEDMIGDWREGWGEKRQLGAVGLLRKMSAVLHSIR